jgi:uncharacterized protein
VIVLHHDDLDGRCAAAIVLLAHPDAKCIEMNYKSELPLGEIEKGEEVIIVDFSLQKPGDWQLLREHTDDIVWIDHHESSLNNAPEWLNDCRGLGRTDRCGAKLTWGYYLPDDETPAVVNLIDKWDRWVHNDDPDVLNFVSGMRLRDHSPMSQIWRTLLENTEQAEDLVQDIQLDGVTISQFETMNNAQAVKHFAYPLTWENHSCIILHTDRAGSKLFDSVKGQYEIVIPVNFDGTDYTIHLYSETVKVNDIAEKYGGGGHPGAAGFICKELPWHSLQGVAMAQIETAVKPKTTKIIRGDLVVNIHDVIGSEGCKLFLLYLLNYGTVSPVLIRDGFPHPVHFREGKRIRNAMRVSGFCDGWTDEDYDNNWEEVVKQAMRTEFLGRVSTDTLKAGGDIS